MGTVIANKSFVTQGDGLDTLVIAEGEFRSSDDPVVLATPRNWDALPGQGVGGGSLPDSRLFANAAAQTVNQTLIAHPVFTAAGGYPVGADISLNGDGTRFVIATTGIYSVIVEVGCDDIGSNTPATGYFASLNQIVGTSFGGGSSLIAFCAPVEGSADLVIPLTWRLEAGDEWGVAVEGFGPAGAGDTWNLEGSGSTYLSVIRLA